MYDSNTQDLSDKLKETSSTVFTQDTIDSILSLISTPSDPKIVIGTFEVKPDNTITVDQATELAFIQSSDTEVTKIILNTDAPAIFFQGKGGVDAIIGGAPASAEGNSSAASADPDAIERVVVGTIGADKITIADSKNTKVIAGDKDVIKAGDGHTVVVAAEGSSTVVGGDDTIVVAAGKEEDFTVTVEDGHVMLVNSTTKVSVDMTGVNFVQLDGADALIFADNAKQAAVANMYHAVLGRNADASGLEFWFDRADDGVSLTDIAQSFLSAAEYTGNSLSHYQFISAVYSGLTGSSGSPSKAAEWYLALSNGTTTRAEMLAELAESSVDEDVAGIVGSVTIIDGGTLS